MQTTRTFRLGETTPEQVIIKYINMKPTSAHTTHRAITHNVLCIALCACIVSAFISACAFVPTTSNFPRDKVQLGMNTREVRGIMGKPFSEDTFVEGEKRVMLGEMQEYEPLCRHCYQKAMQGGKGEC